LTYSGTGSLLNSASWTKAPQPVFQSAGNVVGVGHASFVKSPDGAEDWIVYHAHKNPVPPSGEIRDVRTQPFTFFADGTPNFGPPIATHLSIRAPSVGPDPERFFVAGDYNADGLAGAADHATWRATFGTAVFPGSGADGNYNGVVDTADYVIWRKNQSAANVAAAATALPQAPPSQSPHASADTRLPPAAVKSGGPAAISPRHGVRAQPANAPDLVDAVFRFWRPALMWNDRQHTSDDPRTDVGRLATWKRYEDRQSDELGGAVEGLSEADGVLGKRAHWEYTNYRPSGSLDGEG
jgi:hypothetical protein